MPIYKGWELIVISIALLAWALMTTIIIRQRIYNVTFHKCSKTKKKKILKICSLFDKATMRFCLKYNADVNVKLLLAVYYGYLILSLLTISCIAFCQTSKSFYNTHRLLIKIWWYLSGAVLIINALSKDKYSE